jgi:hypothetical protein
MYTGCTVSNTALATAIGFNTLDINYDLTAWKKSRPMILLSGKYW